MTDELLNHQHCKVCDRALPFGDGVCQDHKAEYEAHQRKRRRTAIFFYVATAVMVILLLTQLGPLVGQ